MRASKVDKVTLLRAADACGVLLDLRQVNARGTIFQVKVNPGTPPDSVWQIDRTRPRLCPVCGAKVRITGETTGGRLVGSCGDAATRRRWSNGRRWKDEHGDGKYQRMNAGYHDDRRVHAVCWHGFRDFFREVFKLAPDAVFRTALDTWKGSVDFEARFHESGHRNVGSQMCPRSAAEVCRCPESGSAR